MKFPLYLLLLAGAPAFAQKQQNIPSTIDKVTVFIGGAQINRSAQAGIPTGTTTLVFQGVSPELDERSIQVQGEGDFTILSVARELNVLKVQEKRERTSKLETQQDALNDKLTHERNNLKVYMQEEAMLTKNQDIKSEQTGVKTGELREAMDFQRARLTEVLDKQAVASKNIKVLEKELTKINEQLAVLNAANVTATTDLLVTISSERNINGRLTLSYLVKNAGWYPTYDLRVKNIREPLQLTYKAHVYQACGEDWKDVKLSLSNGSPSENMTRPDLQPWYLQLANHPLRKKSVYLEENISAYGIVAAAPVKAEADEYKLSKNIAVTERFSPTTVTFDIANPYTIVSDGKPNTVAIKEQEVPVNYQYYAAPKLDKFAYLTAGIADWEMLNLMDGETNIYFEGTYVGKSFLDLRNAGDTLQLSLGRDKNIIVNRTMQKDYSQRQLLGNYKTDTRHWELSIKNNKRDAVKVILQDQLPISTTKEIELSKVEVEDAQQDEVTKMLSWTLQVDPGKDVKKHVKYAVRYPKNEIVKLD